MYLTPFGGFLLKDDTKPHQFIHMQEGIVDDDLEFAGYDRLTAQYITPVRHHSGKDRWRELAGVDAARRHHRQQLRVRRASISFDFAAPTIAILWQIATIRVMLSTTRLDRRTR